MAEGQYAVDVYQINIGSGDAAIYVQYLRAPKKKTILSAVLIDGGDGQASNVVQRSPWDQVRRTMKRVAEDFNLGEREKLKFDAIVATHWDSDHIKGLVDLILDDLERGFAADPNKTQVEFMKYDGKEPKTIFYLPFWKGTDSKSGLPDLKGAEAYDPWFRKMKVDNVDIDKLEFTITYQEAVTPPLPDPPTTPSFEKKTKIFDNVCVVRHTPETMLGVDFFINEPGPTNPKDIKSLPALIDEGPSDNKPALFCIATDRRMLGVDGPIPIARLSSNEKDVVATESKSKSESRNEEKLGRTGGELYMTSTTTTPDNKVSIVTMVVWRQSQRISYYAAGDLDAFMEEKVIDWTKTQDGTKHYEVPMVKASHHGAAGSFAHKLIESWKTKAVLFSCGYQHFGRQYFHPAWEIVWWMSVEPGYKGQKPIWSTCFPYYLLKSTEPGKENVYLAEEMSYFSLAALDDKVFTDPLEALYKRTDPTDPAQAKQARLVDLIKDETNQKHWLLDQMAQRWSTLSNTDPLSSSFTGTSNYLATLGTESKLVWYHLVECRAAETIEKVTEVRNDGQFSPVTKRIWTTVTSGISAPKRPLEKSDRETRGAKSAKLDAGTSGSGLPARVELSLAEPATSFTAPTLHNAINAGNGVLFYASDFPSDHTYCVVNKPDQKLFLRLLRRQVIGLKEAFATDAESTTPFQDDDEMYTWLANSLGSTALSATGKGGEIHHFDMKVNVVAGQTITLEFSTEMIPVQFDITPADAGSIPIAEHWGTHKRYGYMIFGLKSAFPTISAASLFKYAGFESSPMFNVNLRIVEPKSEDKKTLYRRNAVWFMPGEEYTTTLRLQFEMVELDNLNSFFGSFLGNEFHLDVADLILKKTFSFRYAEAGIYNVEIGSEIIVVANAKIGQKLDFTLTVVITDDGMYKTVMDFNEGSSFTNAIEWLVSLFNVKIDFNQWIPEEYMGSPALSRVSLVFMVDDEETSSEGLKFTGGEITFQLNFTWGGESPVEKVVFFFSYTWPPSRLSGSLWPGFRSTDQFVELYPEYELYQRLVPKADGPVAGGLHLAKLNPNGEVIPIPENVLPTIQSVNVVLDEDQIHFDGSLVWNKSSAIPIVDMTEVRLEATYNWSKSDLLVSLYVRGLLNPRKESLPSADLFGRIAYNSAVKTWSFEAMICNLYLSSLYSFFDADTSDGVMDMLENVEIDVLRLQCDYTNGRFSAFVFYGSVLLGPIRADLEYTRNLSGWTFHIGVGANKEATATVGDLIGSFTGKDINLPPCVGLINLTKAQNQDTFTVNVQQVEKSGAKYLLFHGNFTLSSLGFTFIQLRRTGKTAATKRIIKLGVVAMPNATVPLVGSIPQPFDEMTFMWVEDSGGKGLTREEAQIINKSETITGMPIKFKEPQPANPRQDDIVLQTGLHFMIAVTHLGVSNIILDHRFGEARQATSGVNSTSGERAASSSGTSEVTMAPMQKKIGPLSISNIGLQYLNNTLYVVLDATFQLGPMSMSLLGFGIGINFDGGFNLQKMPSSVVVKLEGLAVGFERPPITMAGEFRYANDLYQGGITVGFTPYLFSAAGFYGEVEKRYNTVFIFAKLSGPLVTLAFAEISGICGAFGYNNKLTFPTVTQVPSFPFVGDNMDASSPMLALQQLTGPSGWVQTKEDVFWLAAGMSVKAFRVLSLDAVVVIEFNPYVNLGLFAICQASLPPKKTSGPKFMYVELGIAATVDFQAGTLKVEGQLTPNSFILAPSCHLTGGFALFYWFGESEHEGDWVFTIGGYHPAYVKPTHYPNPPRLGISWKLDNNLSITGESYFAITPKCCMAGGRLHAALSLGPLSAWFDAQANFLVNYNPFSFMADVSVSVGVKFTLDLWICTIRISVEIGAKLYLEGPPFRGYVHVNFWVFGFNIEFGPKPEGQPAVDLEGFWKMLLQDGVSSVRSRRKSRRAAIAPEATSSEDHVLAVESGLLPTSEKDAEVWDVRGGVFAFRIQSRFAIGEAACTGDGKVSYSAPIFGRPLHLKQALSSKMNITITEENATRAMLAEELDIWQLSQVVKSVPNALWGKYDEKEDPTKSSNNIKTLLNGQNNTTSLMMGITVTSPRPTLSQDKIPKFNFVHAMAQDVYHSGDPRPQFPVLVTVGETFLPGKPEAGEKQWDIVQEKWGKAEAEEAATTALNAWKAAFRWGNDTKVSAKPPKRAIDELKQLYMVPPLICAAA